MKIYKEYNVSYWFQTEEDSGYGQAEIRANLIDSFNLFDVVETIKESSRNTLFPMESVIIISYKFKKFVIE